MMIVPVHESYVIDLQPKTLKVARADDEAE